MVALGRKANTASLKLENTKVMLNEFGFVRVNDFCQTADPSVFAVGDITGPPLLAHRASAMGRVAAEAIAGLKTAFDFHAIPEVVYCDPEVATVGYSETECQEKKIEYIKGFFPFSELGRAISTDHTEGYVKVLAEQDSHAILGFEIVGPHASELIGAGAMAVEFGAQLEDISGTIFPHPTFSEAFFEACEDALKKSVRVWDRID